MEGGLAKKAAFREKTGCFSAEGDSPSWLKAAALFCRTHFSVHRTCMIPPVSKQFHNRVARNRAGLAKFPANSA
jgi:hypothetical protein